MVPQVDVLNVLSRALPELRRGNESVKIMGGEGNKDNENLVAVPLRHACDTRNQGMTLPDMTLPDMTLPGMTLPGMTLPRQHTDLLAIKPAYPRPA